MIAGIENGDPEMEQFFDFSIFQDEDPKASYYESWDEGLGEASISINGADGCGGENFTVAYEIKKLAIEELMGIRWDASN